MVLQSSGPISFSQIEAEFGQNNGRDLGEYRVTQTVDSITRNLDNGIPGSGSISFQQFYGKRLNVIVRYNSNQNRPSKARDKYDANSGVVVIGGFRSRPNNGGNGIKVFIHVSATIGSTKSNNRDVCALRTGTWNNGVHLNVDLGGNGQIRGAGGNGGSSSFGPYLSAGLGYGANRNNQHSGGVSGSGSGGSLNIHTGGGGNHHQRSGYGGSSFWGGNTAGGHPQGGNFSHNHQSHSAPGSGGSGGYFNSHRGSNGRPGMIVITHFK